MEGVTFSASFTQEAPASVQDQSYDITDISTGRVVENRYYGETLRIGRNIPGPCRPDLLTRIGRRLKRMMSG